VQRIEELEHPSTELQNIAQELNQPIVGSEDEVQQILNKQENILKSIIDATSDNKDVEFRKRYFKAGVVDSLIYIINTYQLDKITLNHMECIRSLLLPNKEIIQLFVEKNPFPGIIRLLDQTEQEIKNYAYAILSIILMFGFDESKINNPCSYFDAIQACGGIDKIMELS
ncbi:MAG: hypothetical protein EZS28_055472, partial [Streblomastix strix]